MFEPPYPYPYPYGSIDEQKVRKNWFFFLVFFFGGKDGLELESDKGVAQRELEGKLERRIGTWKK